MSNPDVSEFDTGPVVDVNASSERSTVVVVALPVVVVAVSVSVDEHAAVAVASAAVIATRIARRDRDRTAPIGRHLFIHPVLPGVSLSGLKSRRS